MNAERRDAWRERRSEESGNGMGTILKIFFSIFAIKHQGKRQRRRGGERECSLPVEALTEDESFLEIKEAPPLIIPWWDASIPIHHRNSRGYQTKAGQRIQGRGQHFLRYSFGQTKSLNVSKVFFFRLKLQEVQPHWDGNDQNRNNFDLKWLRYSGYTECCP